MSGQRRVEKHKVKTINEAYCKGCGYCIEFCPKKVFDRKVELNAKGLSTPVIARPEDCIGCGQCSLLCPDLAIILEDVET